MRTRTRLLPWMGLFAALACVGACASEPTPEDGWQPMPSIEKAPPPASRSGEITEQGPSQPPPPPNVPPKK